MSLTERRGLVAAALDSAERASWGDAAVTTSSLDGVEVRVAALDGARPCWAVRTHGLFADAGVEVGLRLPRQKDQAAPPAFVPSIMSRLCRYARSQSLSPGQVVTWPAPFGEGVETDLAAFAVTVDPAFAPVRTAHDEVPMLLAVGLTADEARLVREWSPQGLLEVLAKLDPTLSTSLERASLLASPRARVAVEQRVEREGSSMGTLIAERSELSGKAPKTWTIDTLTADALLSLLKGRIGHQRPFTVRSGAVDVEVAPGEAPALTVEGRRATLKLTQAAARAMRATLKAAPGRYTWDELPALTIVVSPGAELRPAPAARAVNVTP